MNVNVCFQVYSKWLMTEYLEIDSDISYLSQFTEKTEMICIYREKAEEWLKTLLPLRKVDPLCIDVKIREIPLDPRKVQ